MQIDNALALSTAHQARPPRRYVSVTHAVDSYLEMRTLMSGCIGLDYERPMVQCAPAPENPHLMALSDVQQLEQAFGAASQRVSEEQWQVWCAVRVGQSTYRELRPLAKTTARNWVVACDQAVEQALADRRLLVRSRADLDRGPLL